MGGDDRRRRARARIRPDRDVGGGHWETPGGVGVFALGWLLLFVGFILTGIGAYRARLLGSARILPIVIAVGAFVAIVVSVDPFHDIGFLVVGLGWILLGVALWRRHGHDRSHTHPVRADLGVPG